MKVLFVDSCMKQGEESRTKILCNSFLEELKKVNTGCEIETVVLKDEEMRPYNNDMVDERYKIVEDQDWDHPMLKYAKQFAEADRIVIGAPYWDLAFPSLLKIYIEHIFVSGLTFEATDKGLKGLSKADKAVFIQTAGGFVGETDPGTEYLKYVLKTLGVQEFTRVSADFIDVVGVNVEEKLAEAKKVLKDMAAAW
ncbi:MAG: NAD(P)H-dependent oxidoreductase [Firmicutes bacterium]|nr:NAD(P)H-dependent oxidoreductase [Bacillota bacterium]